MDLITQVAEDAAAFDGTDPLDEATRLALRHRPGSVRSWTQDNGFAVLIGGELSLVVAPDARGQGVGGQLLDEVLSRESGALSAWSHGDHPAAAALARRTGFDRVRELWVMRRATATPLDKLRVPAGIEVRGYDPADEDELLRVNAAAFAHHPEQGAMDAANLRERMAEPWFDPTGLLVATDGTRLLGFHWTKRHSPQLGEVYVVGIDPAEQGRGLGRLLTLAGLHHLADAEVDQVLLYVESDNAPAIATYSGLGFTHAPSDTHVMYRKG